MLLALSALSCGGPPQREKGPPSQSAAPPPRALGAPRVLASAPHIVQAFAQDGDQIAWWGGCALHVRTLATGAETRIPCANPDWEEGFEVSFFAFAGGRALWSLTHETHFHYEQPQTASLGDSKTHSLGEELVFEDRGERIGGMAGDAATLVYTTYELGRAEDGYTPTNWNVGGGRLWRIVGGARIKVPAAGAFTVAVSGQHAAFLYPAGFDGERFSPYSDHNTTVDVRDLTTGGLLSSFEHSGRATAVALSAQVVALLVYEASGETRIETYSLSGTRLAQVDAPSGANDLSIAGQTVVYSGGRTIFALNARSGRKAAVAIAREPPIGLSIEGRRIAWAERGRIVAVYLSG